MDKIFAYLRVSGAKQLDGSGFDRQLDTVKKYCKQTNSKIEKVFREQVSGTKDETERPVFYDMIAEIMSNHCRTVVVESLDRLARAYRIQESLLVVLASKEIALIAANTGENITEAIKDDPMKKALVQIQGVISELDRSMIIKRLQDGRKKSNKPQGVKPYGQHPDYPEERDVLNKMKTLRRATKTRKALSFAKVAAKLNEEGIKTRYKRDWNPVLVFYALRKNT
ncbi:MAG: recombinase family protein [Candidatus Njordarchaeales archaeon]